MYGLVNLAIEEAIIERYGLKFWEFIKQSCRESIGDTEDGTFISRLFYDDELTYQLINAAEKTLRSDQYGQLSQSFGEKFFELVHDSGYEGILKLLGGSFKDFLDNLDSFHTHLSATYTRMKAPSFRCTYVYENGVKVPDKLILHYCSERVGLEGIVMGMVKAAARVLHKIDIDISIHKLKLLDQGIDHTEFIISDISKKKRKLSKCHVDNDADIRDQQLVYDDIYSPFYEDEGFNYKCVDQLARGANISKVSPLIFAQALPFHLIFDRKLIIKQAGTSTLRVIPALNTRRDVCLTEVMNLLEPKCIQGKLTFDNLLKYINSIYVFRPDEKQVISGGHRHLHGDYLKKLKLAGSLDSRSDVSVKRKQPDVVYDSSQIGELPEEDIDKYIVKLRGQMIYMEKSDLMLFVCSPSVANLDDLHNTGLFLSDIPLHDATRDLVLLSEQFEAEYKVQKKLTMLTEQLNVMKCELEEEKKKTDRLLYSVLPPTVANELRNNRAVPAKRYQHVTILFSGIVGFSDFCARNSDSSGAIRIVNLLNKIYTTFDVLTEPKRNPYVYKVETVGDKYMAVSGLPEACDSHARHINRLALDIQHLASTIMLEEYTGIKTIATPTNDDKSVNSSLAAPEATQMDQCEHLRVTMGVHCGEVVTGVIGKRTPRYCLFGNTVNLTSRCETTGKKGAINVSQDVYNLCTKDPNNFDPEFEFEYRGQVNMKGKSEPMGMWFLNRRRLG